MDLSRLNTFKVVAETLSFTKAGRELGLTQPAVSRQMKTLEEELGKKLLFRNKKSISLTKEGEVVLSYATKLLDQVKSMRLEVLKSDGSVDPTVRIIASTRSLSNPFPELRSEWAKINPEIEVVFTTTIESQTIVESIQNGISDIGFTTYEPGFEGVEIIPWGEFDMIPVVGPGHELSGGNPVDIMSLREQQWILFEIGSWIRRDTDVIFQRYNFEPARVYESNDGQVIKQMVANGTGISLLPEWGIVKELESGILDRVEIVDVRTNVNVGLVVLKGARSEAVELFIGFMLRQAVEGIRLASSDLQGD